MTIDPILTAPAFVQMHVLSALIAVVLGPVVLARKSRDKWHKRCGYIWVMAMALTALSSFWISDIPMIGPFGPIHILSVITLYGLAQAIMAIRAGRRDAHQKYMKALYFWAIGVAGLFTFLPGRRMNTVFFAHNPEVGFAVMAVLIGGGLGLYIIREKNVAI